MKKITTTNRPYLQALSLIYHCLRWDINPESWRSRRKMAALRNTHQGEACLIVCNGPSLNTVDFNAVVDSGIFTIGLNKINLMFSKTAWRPSVICACNKHVLEQNTDFFRETEIPVFLDSRGTELVGKTDSITFVRSVPGPEFFGDMTVHYSQGCTVTFMAMQLAFHMGFSRVGLIGCDHNFNTKGPAHKSVKAEDSDPNHFDPSYFSKGVIWELPDLPGSEFSYELARRSYESAGRSLVNCTDGGKLEIFPRQNLSDFLEENSVSQYS